MEKAEELKEKIKEAYERGEGSFQKLADRFGVKVGTIKSWSKRDKDEGNQWFKVATKKKKTKNQSKLVAENKKMVAREEKSVAVKEDKAIRKTVERVLENKELNDKQKLFCIYYIKSFNATKAYQKAYKCAYSTAMTNGNELLRNTQIGEQIERLKADKLKGAYLSANDLLQKYIDIALSDIKDYMKFGQKEYQATNEETGEEETRFYNYVDFLNSDEVDGTLISEVKQGKDGVSIKLIDKKFALDFLAKYSGLLDIPTQQKLDIERRKMDLLEKQADDLEDDIEYILVEDDLNEET